MLHNSPALKMRKAISLDTKIKILDQLATGQGATVVGNNFGIHEATVRTIKKNETAIRASVCSGTKLSAKSSSYVRDVVKEKMEKALVIWIEDKSQKRIPVDRLAIKQTALRIYKRIQEIDPDTSSQSKQHAFSASTGWMTGFLKRHALHNIKIKGETASADELAAKEFPEKLKKIIEDGEYTPDQVWNLDESGLFWKRMPRRTYVAKSQKTAGGFKVAKDRITLLFCSNASGERILKPLLVHRALRPRSMKSVDFNKLPVHWMANKKAWVTSAIFTEWFQKHFIPEVRRYMKEKCLEFKVLLILDNAPGHPVLEHPNVQFCFLPPNTTSLIQPLDQGIIATFKTYYIRSSFHYVVEKLDNYEESSVIDEWKKFSIMDCINQVKIALDLLKPSTLNSCWKNIWPECVKCKDPVIDNNAELADIITMANAIGGDGFDDLSLADVEELLVVESLSENEIIEFTLETRYDKEHSDSDERDRPILKASLIKEGLDLATKLGSHFEQHDHDEERAAKFQRELKSLMASYREVYNGLTRNKTQSKITDFVQKSTDVPTQSARNDNDQQNHSSDGSDIVVFRKRLRLLSDSDNK
ncbi:tigger transposable element-derived protein 1-like [Bactrocera tryoni]|uniref:tigger transposable element-derived protein 1-like n=1 Tax=Bactrocera tryoni TaxID=59916 RepID=UPI001A9A1A45|nr:tigger transposable element-derived protein 1-like [Bactrocera tryoni]